MTTRRLALVRIVLVGGPLDGDVREISEAFAQSKLAYRCVPPITPLGSAFGWIPDGVIPELPKHLEYRPLMVRFNGWPVHSVTDDGTPRYEYAGER